MPKQGRNFEQAVYSFAGTLDPTATVTFDHHVQDRDTGTLRQCDVWINAKYGGHWPLSILISCKDHSRKLDVGDIGTFVNEVHSTGASTGVIYSRVGFTQPALKKAKANSINCCRIYQDEPADTPRLIVFEQFYCRSRIALDLMVDRSVFCFKTWGQLFDAPCNRSNDSSTVLDEIARVFAEKETMAVSSASGFPSAWRTDLPFHLCEDQGEIKVGVRGSWRRFVARMEATLINGSYCISSGSFYGQQNGPAIDTYSAHPGEGWIEILDDDYILPVERVIMILVGADAKQPLRNLLAHQALFA